MGLGLCHRLEKGKEGAFEAIEAGVGGCQGTALGEATLRHHTLRKKESSLPSADLSKLPTEDVIQQSHLHGICPILAANITVHAVLGIRLALFCELVQDGREDAPCSLQQVTNASEIK